ncbi:hypothetical protein N2152v2_005329 [Parachlorella kessleri]
MDDVRSASETFISAAADVLTNANRSQFAAHLRKLYLARQTLHQRCSELNVKLEAAKQRIQVQEAERIAAEEAAAVPTATVTSIKPEAEEEQQAAEWADQLLVDGGGTPGEGGIYLADMPQFDLGMDTQPVAAPPAVSAKAAEGGLGLPQVATGPSSQDWAFPVFVGHRRRLPPHDALFESGNEEREELAKQAALAVTRNSEAQLAKEATLGGKELAKYLAHKFECATCHAALPTAHLLECHIAEMHDSFFAAQAARRMQVYKCLVEGCGRKFCTIEERKQHLTDHHRFPRNYNFDRIHLRRRKAQIRPLPAYQKASPPVDVAIDPYTGRADEDGDTVIIATRVAAVPRAHHDSVGGASSGDVAAAGGTAGGDAASAGGGSGGQQTEQRHDEEVVSGLGRLSVAAAEAMVPRNISFGRHLPGRGMPGAGRGRGAGGPGVKAPHQGEAGGRGPAGGVDSATGSGAE